MAGGIGLMSALLGVGGGVGVVLSGPIVDHLSYHYLFWLPLIPIVIATALIQVFVPESPIRVPGRVNWAGAALMSTGLAAVLIAVSETANWHWLSAKTIGADRAPAVVLLAFWVRSETRSDHPLVDMRMMRIRGVWTTNTVALLLGFGMYSSFILLPQYVETPTVRGLRIRQLRHAGRSLPRPLDADDADRRLADRPAREALRVEAAAARRRRRSRWRRSLILAFARTERWEVYLAAALLGAGIGLAFAAMANLIIENVGPEQTGVATGMNTVTRTVGGAFGGAATASILAGTVTAERLPDPHGFTLAFAACAVALGIGILVGLAIPQRRPEQAFEPHEVGDLAAGGRGRREL